MIEQALVEYVANALWQVPLLAGGAWLLLAALKAGPRLEHGVWLMVLGLAVALPLHGMGTEQASVQVRPNVSARWGVGDVGAAGGDSEGQRAGEDRVGEWRVEVPLRPRRVEISVTAARWVAGFYAGAVMFGLWRVIWAWRAARRLVERSRKVTLAGEQTVVLEDYGRRLSVRLPQVRASVEISSPMIVGMVAPVLLLPVEFARHGAEEMRAALLHELAHVKRRDTLENAVCQLAALPVSWHPMTQWVQRRIRRTREMVCDAMAAEEMQSELGYARCLLTLAKGVMAGREFERETAGVGLFHSNVLEERVMRLMEKESGVNVRTRLIRVTTGAVAMTTTIAMAAMFHLTPTMAQEQRPAPTPQQIAAPVPDGAQAAASPAVQDEHKDSSPGTSSSSGVSFSPSSSSASDGSSSPGVSSSPSNSSSSSHEAVVIADEKNVDASAPKRSYAHRWTGPKGRQMVMVNGEPRELTAEEQRHVDEEIERASKEIAEATARINSPEFRRQIAEAAAASAKVNSAEFKEQMAEVQRITANVKAMELPRIQEDVARATAQVNSPEFKQQMAEMQKQLNGEVQQRMAEAMKQMKEAQEELENVSPK